MQYKNIEFKNIYKLKNESNEVKLLGPNNSFLKTMEDLFKYPIIISKSTVSIPEDCDEKEVICLFETMEEILATSYNLNMIDIVNIIQSIKNDTINDLKKVYLKKEVICVLSNGKAVFPKTINQAMYLSSMNKNEIVFGIGPAGTGKTYLAVLYASNLLKHQQIKKIVLVRPVVEAGEKLGFLPGDLKEKIDPYLIPLYDCLEDCFGKDHLNKMMEKGVIEVAPLAYMRGRTLDNACIILDEAQNTTLMQMKMFLTRLGFNSKMFITGDISQIDLVNKRDSGLIEASKILNDIDGIKFIYFTKSDVMRNPLVYKIIEKYEEK